MPKKSKDEFKAAFKAFKKPEKPQGFTSKDKSVLESAMDKKGVGEKEFRRLAAELYEKEPKYLVDLIAYKLVKHFDDVKKRPMWVGLVPPEAFEKALAKVVPDDMSERLTQVTLEKSVTGGKERITGDLIYERDPDRTIQFALDKWIEANAKGDKDRATSWVEFFPPGSSRQAPNPDAVERNKRMLDAIMESGNEAAAKEFGERMSEFVIIKDEDLVEGGRGKVMGEVKPFPLDHAAVLETAKKNPKLFASQILPAMKAKNEFTEIVTDPDIQDLLAKKAPEEWAKLVATTPVLKVLDHLDKSVQLKGLTEQDEIVGELFDAIVNNQGIPLAYYTNPFTPNSMILSGGGSEKDKALIETNKKTLKEEAPDLPCTQCHNLLHLTTLIMEASGSMPAKPKIVQDTCDNMLLTVKLSTLPGKGLLDKSFSGNVFDDGDQPTGQILFTGDEGKNSHTWLVIDGVPFDPVLGTRGDEVAASIDERFDWLSDRVARGSKGNYIIKGAGKDGKKIPQAASNKMGFGTGYRLTTTPETYLKDEELETAGLGPVVAK